MKTYDNGITKKNKFLQLFCRHKNIGNFEENRMFQSISGETIHRICTDCGKHIGTTYHKYEGMGYK